MFGARVVYEEAFQAALFFRGEDGGAFAGSGDAEFEVPGWCGTFTQGGSVLQDSGQKAHHFVDGGFREAVFGHFGHEVADLLFGDGGIAFEEGVYLGDDEVVVEFEGLFAEEVSVLFFPAEGEGV